MRELSLHVLDIAQNSIAAGATCIELNVEENVTADQLRITVKDNGRGMTPEQLKQVRDPFYTTRTTRKVGMGVPLFRMAAEMAGGGLELTSEAGKGTTLSAWFVLSHIDRMPLGDMRGTVTALIRLNPTLDFVYRRQLNERNFTVDTRELREVLGDVPLNTPEVMEWIDGYIQEQEETLVSGKPDMEQKEGASL